MLLAVLRHCSALERPADHCRDHGERCIESATWRKFLEYLRVSLMLCPSPVRVADGNRVVIVELQRTQAAGPQWGLHTKVMSTDRTKQTLRLTLHLVAGDQRRILPVYDWALTLDET